MRSSTTATAVALSRQLSSNNAARFQCLSLSQCLQPRFPLTADASPLRYSIPPTSVRTFTTSRNHASSSSSSNNPTIPDQPPLKPRWLSNLKTRLGKCMTFGLSPSQTNTASAILQELSSDWRRLLAGSEGFLTSDDRAGLVGQRVVWGEMDCMSHVNNVTYTRYAESARIEWAAKFAQRERNERRRGQWMDLWSPRGRGLILRSIRTDYKFPMTWPDHISVYHKLRSSPHSGDTTSFILDVVILSHKHQRPSARCIEDIVVYDYKTGKKTELNSWMRDEFQRTFELQEAEKRSCLAAVDTLERRVRQLEVESWDREDAKEDLGSADRA